jgi:single-strand DNA-binding protein
MSTTITGNITADPELRFTANGTAVCNFTIATTPRKYDKATEEWIDGDTLFMRCTTWGTQAENMAEKLAKGARVVATGDLEQHQYTDGEGVERISVELSVDEIGSSLRYAEKSAAPTQKAPARTAPARGNSKPAQKQYARNGQGSRSPQTVGGGR